MDKNNRIKTHNDVEKELQDLKRLERDDPEAARIVAKVALIKTGVLNENGGKKEQIIESPHIGYEEENMSYEEVIATMRMCINSLRQLGEGDIKKTHAIARQSLVDSGFVSKDGHIVVRELRSPQVEEFFRRVESEHNVSVSNKQRIRK